MLDELRRVALFSSGVAELTRHQAEQMVKDLVKSGEVRRKQASTAVKDLLERSQANRKELARFVRGEIQNQIESLGLATKRDLERMERRIARLEADRKAATKKKGSPGGRADESSSSTPRKTSTRKTSSKKTSAKKPPATRSGPS